MGLLKGDSAASLAPAGATATGGFNAILDRGSAFEGKLTFEGTVRIDGKFKGEIHSDANLVIGESTSEEVKITIGNVYPEKEVKSMEIRGRDSISGLPRILTIDSVEIREALQEPTTMVLEEIKKTLDQTPPELAADIVERGIVMTGGGSLLRGFTKLISKETGVPVILAENPLTCVVMGTGKFLEELRYIKKVK